MAKSAANESSIYLKLTALVTYSVVSFGVIALNKLFYSYISAPLLSAWMPQVGCVVVYLILSGIGFFEDVSSNSHRKVSSVTWPSGAAQIFKTGGPFAATAEEEPPAEEVRPLRFGLRFRRLSFPLICRFGCLAMAYAPMVYLNNLCLINSRLSVYQVARSFTMLFNLLFARLFLKSSVPLNSLTVTGVVLLVTGYLTTVTAGALNWRGALAGLGGSFCQATHAVLVKLLVSTDLRKDDAAVTFYTAAFTSLFLAIPSLLTDEWSALASIKVYLSVGEYRPLVYLFGSVSAVVLVSYLLPRTIRISSPLSLNVAGNVKSTGQTLYGILWNGDPYTPQTLTGVTLALTGSAIYGAGRLRIHGKKNSEAALADSETKALLNEDLETGKRKIEA